MQHKPNVKNSVGKIAFVGLIIVAQTAWLITLAYRLNDYSTFINTTLGIIAFLLALRIYGKNENAAFKMPWILLILMLPPLGICLYLLFGHKNATKRVRAHFARLEPLILKELPKNDDVIKKLEWIDITAANQFRYVANYGKYPVYENTGVKFYPEASAAFEAQLRDLSRATRFIFMEYHAIEEAQAFGRLRDVLVDRVKNGVEVRIFYDEIGSVGFIDTGFIKRMSELGIRCRVFNPMLPILSIFMNNRDHRKITVIDGKVGFTGGYNLADEYFGITTPYGKWKDSGLRLEGGAVQSLTAMFLEMWNAMGETDRDYKKYFPRYSLHTGEKSFVQPYADKPLDDEYVGENVYLNMIKAAKHRFYATTPYLIISDEMCRELCLAAQRGVDVRIITPGIPDKKLIFAMTRSYYPPLCRRGVRIYEYTPGFMHSKQVISDDKTAVVGTINFDYRSLYHHFENAVLMYNTSAMRDIERDFESIMTNSKEVTEEYRKKRMSLTAAQSFRRLFAPLL